MTKAKNFENCIIYKLVCLDTTYPEVYVGSTTCFKQRKFQHKSDCNNENAKSYNYKVYQYVREHGGFDNFTMIEIEKYACENNRQLEAREEYFRKELHATLNGKKAFRTNEERLVQMLERQKNEGHASHLLSMKKWYAANKEKRKLYQKEYHLRKKLEKLNKEIPETNII